MHSTEHTVKAKLMPTYSGPGMLPVHHYYKLHTCILVHVHATLQCMHIHRNICGYRNVVIGLMFIYRHATEQW